MWDFFKDAHCHIVIKLAFNIILPMQGNRGRGVSNFERCITWDMEGNLWARHSRKRLMFSVIERRVIVSFQKVLFQLRDIFCGWCEWKFVRSSRW